MSDIIDNKMQDEAKKLERRKSTSSETLNLAKAKELWAKASKFAGPSKGDAKSNKSTPKSSTTAIEPKSKMESARSSSDSSESCHSAYDEAGAPQAEEHQQSKKEPNKPT